MSKASEQAKIQSDEAKNVKELQALISRIDDAIRDIYIANGCHDCASVYEALGRLKRIVDEQKT